MRYLCVLLVGAAVAAPAAAQSAQFSTVVSSEVGYSNNPRLQPGVTRGSVSISNSVAPRLLYTTARSTTELDGKYSRDSYLNGLGYTDSGLVSFLRSDQLSQFLSSTLTARYLTSNRSIIDPLQPVIDPAALGQRTNSLTAGYQLQWQASARDQFSYGGQVQHQSYGGGSVLGRGVPSSYTQYSANAGYNRIVDARTTVGAQVTLSTTKSKAYPNSRVIQPALTIKRQLSAVWTVDGHVGVVLQHIYGPLPRSTTSLGLGLNLCAAYPRTHVCLDVSRDTAPSAYGSLQVSSRVSLNMTHELDERSRITADAQYIRGSSSGIPTAGVIQSVPDSTAYQGSIDYDRTVTQRISAGFGGRYQRRVLTGIPLARAYTATVHITAKLGRI